MLHSNGTRELEFPSWKCLNRFNSLGTNVPRQRRTQVLSIAPTITVSPTDLYIYLFNYLFCFLFFYFICKQRLYKQVRQILHITKMNPADEMKLIQKYMTNKQISNKLSQRKVQTLIFSFSFFLYSSPSPTFHTVYTFQYFKNTL